MKKVVVTHICLSFPLSRYFHCRIALRLLTASVHVASFLHCHHRLFVSTRGKKPFALALHPTLLISSSVDFAARLLHNRGRMKMAAFISIANSLQADPGLPWTRLPNGRRLPPNYVIHGIGKRGESIVSLSFCLSLFIYLILFTGRGMK